MLLENLKEKSSLFLLLVLSILTANATFAANPAAKKATAAVTIAPAQEEIDIRVEKLVKVPLGINNFWVTFLNGVRSYSDISLLNVMPATSGTRFLKPAYKFGASNLNILRPYDTKYILGTFSSNMDRKSFETKYLSQLRTDDVTSSTKIMGLTLNRPYQIKIRLNEPNLKLNLPEDLEGRRKIWEQITRNRDFIYDLRKGEYLKNLEADAKVEYKKMKTKIVNLVAYLIKDSGIRDFKSLSIESNDAKLLNQEMIVLEFSAKYDNILDFVNKLNNYEKYLLLTCGVTIDQSSSRENRAKNVLDVKLLLSFPYRSTQLVF
ncbi:hypothetical protein AAEX28_06980 [Lentisphaerota bacterium WC36G]|nr:hypothetical protein LJT99_09845 [Lentisphaerae bacterium WC36]